MIKHPPILESTTLSVSASLSSSWPTIFTNGYPRSTSAAAASVSALARMTSDPRDARFPVFATDARARAASGVPAMHDMDAIVVDARGVARRLRRARSRK